MGKRKIVNALGKVEGREYTEAVWFPWSACCALFVAPLTALYMNQALLLFQEGLMPKKRFYRQRAHCNPLNDTVIDTPACPGDVNWSEHYPAFFNQTPGGDKQEEPRVSIADVGCGFGGMSITCAASSRTVCLEVHTCKQVASTSTLFEVFHLHHASDNTALFPCLACHSRH